MAITRPQLHDAIVQTKEYIDKNVNELQDKIYSRGGYVIVDSLPVQNVKIDKTYLVPKVDSNGYAISGSYLEYIYAARYNSGTTITDGLIDFIYEKFIKLIPNSGNYAFIYNGTIWEYDNQEVILSDYGITILDGIPVENDTITISVSNGSWEPVGDATLDLSNYYNKTEIDAKETTINNSIAIINANIAKKENIFRYENMIMPHSGLANKIIQYVGESGTFTQPNFSINLVKGYYYKCVIDPNNNSFTKSGRSWDDGDYSSYDLSFEQEFTVSVYIKRVYVYIDNVGLYTGLYDTINGRRNYDGTTVTFTLPAGSVLSFRSSGQNNAQVSNLTFTGTLYKWEQHNVQPNGTTINSLNDINNVDISEPEDNQIIAYNEETEKWENKTINVNPSSIIDDAITSVNNTWSANKISENLNNKQDKAQYSIMPTPSAKYLNKTIQYVGTTDDNYINSYFYKCEYDEENDEYKWNNKLTQPSTEISDVDGLPSGGTQGQILIKQSSTDGDADWNDIPKENQTISLADFNALPQSEKDNGTTYYIYDSDGTANKTVMGYTPIGTVISIMGNHAPLHYLICDGTEYNIADYPELADYFENEFGSKNKFGGNGTTTFAVPDLQGEFLRGAGTNSYANQGSGGDVGEHQDSTEMPSSYGGHGTNNQIGIVRTDSRWSYDNMGTKQNFDNITANPGQMLHVGNTTPYPTDAKIGTIRPTNTSVLYCIATKNIYTNPENIYSTDETVVGRWIDGKPLYQKTVDFGALPNKTTKNVSHNISNLSEIISMSCIAKNSSNIYINVPYNNIVSATNSVSIYFSNTAVSIETGADMSSYSSTYVTIQYTKTTD